MECYFDNSATTKPLPEVAEAMVETLTEAYGNPSSLHKLGDRANRLLEKARKQVADDYQLVTMSHGLCSLAGTRMYTCMQHDDEAMQRTLRVWEYLLSLIPEN